LNDEWLISKHYVSAESMQALLRPAAQPEQPRLEVPAA
jgi:hypothetical protein